MKKLFLFIICAVLSIGARAQFSGSGNGTEEDPYRIYTDIHLAQMANFLNQEGVVFELMKDVDLSSYISENSPSQGWTPIGVESTPFKGVLKGNGHTISGMMVSRPSTDNVGLFGYVSGATITGVNLEGKSIIGRNYVGGIVGTSYGNCTISDCNVVLNGQIAGLCDIGGIVGFNHEASTIKNCNVKSNMSSSGSAELQSGSVGGLCGTVQNAIVNDCSFEGTVSGKLQGVGGLFGSIGNATVTNVNGKGNVVGETITGCIAGNAHMTNTFENVRYTGDVEGTECVSGVVGRLESGSSNTFNNCHHKGIITNSGDYTGGIVGKSEGGCIAGMESCSHFGNVLGKDYVGGVVGAVKSNGLVPTIRTVYGSSSSTSNTMSYGPYYDTMQSGKEKIIIISNCCSVGDIHASDYVGGVVGCDETALTFFQNTETIDTGNTSSYVYTWADNKYTGYRSKGRTYVAGKNDDGSYYYGHDIACVQIINYTETSVKLKLQNNYYSGNIVGKQFVGGIAGYKDDGEIVNNQSLANVFGSSFVGGLVGDAKGQEPFSNAASSNLKIVSNVANNSIISASISNVGRIYGLKANDYVSVGALASAEGNRALTQTKVMLCGVAQDVIDDEQNGTSVGPSMLRLKANYVSWGWNFDDNWNILETECYPYKKYQAAPPVIESNLESQAMNISGQSLNGGTVYLFYKDRDAVSTICNGHNWSFDTEALQSGVQVQLYADVEGMTPSYLTSATVKYPGCGTEEDPWRIYTAEDLQGATNSGYYKLMNDIDLTSWINENSPETGWPAIGRNSTVATYINGDGHKVTGLWINTTEGYNGLFSNYSAGYIKNLNVEVASGKKVKGGDYTGILIGRMANGQIINCSVKGDVEGTVNVGGVAGYIANSSVSSCAFEGKVNTATSNAFAGGVTGLADEVETTSCRVSATITTTGEGSCVGGLYGKTNNGSVTKSTADTKITASGASNYVGGLVGRITSPITLCYSTGTVTASGSDSYTGGLVGYAEASIANSYSTANVSGTQFTAGLVGYTFSTVDKCYASGNVAGVMYGAGLVGELDGANASATNSVAANNKLELSAQSSWGCRVIGGFKNGCAEPNNSNYALNTMQVSLNNVPQKKTDDNIEGVAISNNNLESASTYSGLNWDMVNNWGIEEGEMYPFLLWEVEVVPVAEIKFDKSSATVTADASITLTPTILPITATNKIVKWTSSNERVATVENGVVTAIGKGTATITATTTDGTKLSASCVVTVTKESETPDVSEDDTDIALFDNIIYIEKDEAPSGSKKTFAIKMKNDFDVTGFQCDIYLPEGMSFVQDEDGFYNAALSTERTTAAKTNYFDFELQSDGALRLLCNSTKGYAFSGTDGEVATVEISIDGDLEDGDYPIILKEIELSEKTGFSGVEVPYFKTTLTVTSYKPGDANGDGKVSVSDFSAAASYVLGNSSEGFVFKAADINSDGKITVSDLSGISYIILHGDVAQAKSREPRGIVQPSTISLSDVNVVPGSETTMLVYISNPDEDFSGYQFDMVLPKGLSVQKNADGSFATMLSPERTSERKTNFFESQMMDESTCRVLCASTSNTAFEGNSGAVAMITLVADEHIAEGTYSIELQDAEMTLNGNISKPNLIAGTISVSAPTGIAGILKSGEPLNVYSVQGYKLISNGNAADLNKLPRGMYIINGKSYIK